VDYRNAYVGCIKGTHGNNAETKKDSDVTWNTVELLIPGAQFTVWFRDDGIPFPDFNVELDPDDLFPEGNVTKQFWKNLYWGIEQRRVEFKYQ
jgi:hypothetical protein